MRFIAQKAVVSSNPKALYKQHRDDATARLIAISVSLAVHAALIAFSGGWLEPERMRSEAPMIVSLVDLPEETRQSEHTTRSGTGRRGPKAETGREPEEAQAGGQPKESAVGQQSRLESEVEAQKPPAGGVGSERSNQQGTGRLDELAQRLLARTDSLGRLPSQFDVEVAALAASGAAARVRGASAGIEGPLGERGLLRCEYPRYPEWAERSGVEAEVRYRFWVSPEGAVVRISAIRKPPYPSFDELGREALSHWLFEPITGSGAKEEWGEVTFIWRLGRRRALPTGGGS